MTVILGLAFIISLVAAIAIGTAFVLDISAPRLSLRKRTAIAAMAGGLLPMILPLISVLGGANSDIPSWIPFVAVAMMGITFGLLVGFPSAYLFLKKREEKRGEPIRPETFE